MSLFHHPAVYLQMRESLGKVCIRHLCDCLDCCRRSESEILGVSNGTWYVRGICMACCLLMNLIGLFHIYLVMSGACWQKGVLFVVLHLTLLCTVFKQTIFICISSVLIWRLASLFVGVKNDMKHFFRFLHSCCSILCGDWRNNQNRHFVE